ncbi:hypothetical protein AT3G43645, partial [Arabidopsis thaliana]
VKPKPSPRSFFYLLRRPLFAEDLPEEAQATNLTKCTFVEFRHPSYQLTNITIDFRVTMLALSILATRST